MPSKSPAQARLMAACSHGAGYASCPPVSVAKEFNQADQGTGILKRKKVTEALMASRKAQ
jgi:hypothetical protein